MATAPRLEIAPAQRASVEPVDILTPAELSKRLKLPLSWVYKSVEKRNGNALPHFKCGHYLRFCWPDVVVWLRSNGK